jgi:5-methyltetrahydropteroyltriglutamate--homocysteine methyltransferase
VLIATKDAVLPTTVTGSWPRPSWFTGNLHERPFSSGMADVAFREQYVDAVSSVLSDQELAGLDILTNGDYHLDADLAGRSWFSYPSERFEGISEYDTETTFGWSYPVGSWLNEIVGGWKYHAIVDKIGPRVPLEFAKIWRVAQARTERPVKFGTIAADLAATVLTVKTDAYAQDKQDVMWDIATVLNAELRELQAAGCKVIQIEEPLLHFVAASSRDTQYLDFLIDCFNHEIGGLEDAEVWIHTCWGNANMQRVLERTSYAEVIDTYLERVAGDVWTLEMKDRGFADLELLHPYRSRLKKKIAVGVVSHRTLQVESPEEVANDIRYALNYVEPEQLVLSSDCGFGRQGSNRLVAFYKSAAIVQGANLVRRELGAEEEPVRAADPLLQVDTPSPRTV